MFIRKSTGDTSVLLHRETIQKHGSHDQKTHGRGGKGSGGSDGSSSPQRRNRFTGEPTDETTGVNPFTGKTKQQDIDDAKEALTNNILGAEKVLSNAKNKDAADSARGAVAGFKDVKNALGDKKKMDRVRVKRNSKAAQMMSGSLAPLQDGYRENAGYVNAATIALAQFGDL